MKNILLKTEDNTLILSLGAGMFMWLAISSFLYTLLFTVSKYVLIIAGVDPVFNYCLNETLYSLLLLFIIWKIFNQVRSKNADTPTAKKILIIAVIAYVCCQVLQFIISYCSLQWIMEHYYSKAYDYDEATKSVSNVLKLRMFSSGLEIFRYVAVAFLVFKKITAADPR